MKHIRIFIIIILAAAVFAGSLAVENVVSKSQAVQFPKFYLESGKNIENASLDSMQINFAENAFIRLQKDTVVRFDRYDSQNEQYIFHLLNGRAWVNNLLSSGAVNVIAGGASAVAKNSVFDIRFDGKKSIIYANKHALTVNLVVPASRSGEQIEHNVAVESQSYLPEADFINHYLLPQNNQTTVFVAKILEESATVKKLLYSKLVKEFLVGIVDLERLKNDAWIQNNAQIDSGFLQKVSNDVLQKIRDGGIKNASAHSFGYEFGQVLNRFANALTVSASKTNARTMEGLISHLRDAEYLLVFGRLSEAESRLALFKQLLSEYFSSNMDVYVREILQNLRREYDLLRSVSVGEPLYAAKKSLFNVLFSPESGRSADAKSLLRRDGATHYADAKLPLVYRFSLLRDLMNSVYDLADTNNQSARASLDIYFQNLIDLKIGNTGHLDEFKNVLIEENQLLDNLLRMYPQFYLDRFFGMKGMLEQEWLKLLPDNAIEKNEEKQNIVGNKIDLLNRLKSFFLEDKIGLNEARMILFRLFREAEDLRLPIEAEAAVNELYAKRLKDFGVFFRFLNAPEYVQTTLHGTTREEQFKQYLAAQGAQIDIDQLRREIRGGK